MRIVQDIGGDVLLLQSMEDIPTEVLRAVGARPEEIIEARNGRLFRTITGRSYIRIIRPCRVHVR